MVYWKRKLKRLIDTLSNEIIERCSNGSTVHVPFLPDCMREFLREDELATFETDAWKESCRLENETILEPNDWQEYQHELSTSSKNRPANERIAHRMGTRQIKFPMLYRTGLIAADPHEIIGVSLGENHVDFIYLGIFS